MGAYSYLTFGALKAELLSRLQDPTAQNVSEAEAGMYIVEGLRVLNATTLIWNVDYEFAFNSGDTWKSLNVPGSPRERTVTDSDLYSQMEAMLMEPVSGSVWTGTDQFNIEMLSAALQYRRDELLLQSAANTVNLLQPSPLLSTADASSRLDARPVPGALDSGRLVFESLRSGARGRDYRRRIRPQARSHAR